MVYEKIRKLMFSYVKVLIFDQNMKVVCKLLLVEFVKDLDVKGFMVVFFGDLVIFLVVKSSVVEFGKSVIYQVVNDVEIQ